MGLNSNMAYSSFLKGYLLPIYFLDKEDDGVSFRLFGIRCKAS